LTSALGEDWDVFFSGARSLDSESDERWCTATVGVRSMLPVNGLPLAAGDRCTAAGRALGSSLRSCLARHRLEPSHLVSLRLVTGSADPAIAAPLRCAFLESLHAELTSKQRSSLQDGADDAAGPACKKRQATIIAAPAAAAALEGEELREVHVLVEMVALAIR
jgi:hypothetical protein